MSQSSGLVACGLLEADVATSRGDLQNSLSPSPSLTCRPHKSSEKALRRRNGFRDSFDDGHNTLVDDGRIAIVGMALKMPGADSLDELWQLIKSGTPASTTSIRCNAHRDEGRRAVALKANTGHFVNGLDEFDNGFFNVSPREAKMMDPQQRLLLHVAQEALDDAGFIPRSSYSSDPDHVGVFIGAATNDYVHNVRDDIDIHYAPGGPSTVYDTACSSSATALPRCSESPSQWGLPNGPRRWSQRYYQPDLFMGLDPFDAEADGYSRGEGCGLFVLKCLSDALLDDDRILGIIRGIEANQSYANSSITRTHSPTQAALLRRLLEKSRLRPAHAAGTRQGDTSELLAIQDVFLQQQFVEGRQAPLFLSSIKATIGHLEAASGAASLAKVLLMLQHQTIPRQVGVQKLNSVMNTIPPSQMTIPMETAPWLGKEDGQPRRAIINNYGAAGSNVSIIVEEYVEGAQSTVDTKANSTTVLGLSAKSEQALLDMKEHYIACLNNFCYTATARRQLHKYRLSVASPNSKDKLLKCLDEASIVQAHQGTVEVVLVYPGYGNPAVEESGIVEQTALFSFEVALSKGVLSLEDALLMVGRRAQLVEKRCAPNHSGMMAVPLPSDVLQDMFRANPEFTNLVIACKNSQTRQTVAGPLSELEALRATLQVEHGVHAKLLPGRFAYHSPAMLPIIEDLAAMTKGVEFKPPAILCASTVTGSLLPAGEAMDATHLLRHCLDPVRFSEAVSSLNSTLDNPGNTVCWVEVSPQRTMLPLLRTIIPNPNGTHIFVDSPLPGFDSWAALAEGLSRLYRTNVPVQWKQAFSCFGRPRCIPLPRYPFRCQSFYVPYRDPSPPSRPARVSAPSSEESRLPSPASPPLAFLQRPSARDGREAVLLMSNNHVSTYSDAHKVVSIPICPASLYLQGILDGLTMIQEHMHGRAPKRISISHLEFLKPFIPADHAQMDMILAFRCGTENEHDFSFSSSSNPSGGEYDGNLARETLHARGSCQSQQGMESSTPVALDLSHILRRIQGLDPVTRDDVEVFSAKSVYDVVFPRVVEYAPPFRSLRRVVVTEDRSEGHAIMEVIARQEPPSVLHPAFLDPMVHFPGFVVNLLAGSDEVFVCAGIGSVDLVTSVSCGQPYQIYTTISPLTRGTWLADTVVLMSESPTIVARLKNIQFKKVNRHVLTAQLKPPGGATAPATEPLSPITLPSRSLTRPLSTSPVLPFKAILSTALHIPEHGITDASTLESLGLDSLTSVEVLHALRPQYGVTLSSNLLQGHATVSEVEGALQATFLSSPRSSHGRMGMFNCLEQIQEGPSTRLPVCFIHDGSGSVTSYRRMAALERDVWAIKAPEVEVGRWEEVEEMAAFYVSVISTTLSSGVILAGWSFGGMVAFELAKQLFAAGFHVQGLIFLDAPPPTGEVVLSEELIASILPNDKSWAAGLLQQLKRHVQMVLHHRATKLNPSTPLPCVYLRCTEGYPAPADVDVHEWLTAREDRDATVAEWKALLDGDLHVLDVPGHHFEMFHVSRIESTSQAVSKACNLIEAQ
ncbi:hypothetical protein FA13DRAFT_1769805 [Coprinellus micaceus]|uniref:Uncharacterized protein n=1 Tax=Coprinellus micaceus TaxID=71717 RepID=A0A4Y7U349_COPMI|nr:hypothetical protein FA13DRAFT_1769805 [Coprinellus micaceus]